MKTTTSSQASIRPSIAALATLAMAAFLSPGAIADHHEGKGAKGKVLITSILPTKGNSANGIATFTETPDGVEIRAKVYGLKPNAKHAIHIHEFGDFTVADGTSAGGHFNPDGHEHGLTDKVLRHAGDLGNLQADKNGDADFKFTAKGIRTTTGEHAILGRTLVIHAGADDGGQPTGNAGPRIAVGVIGYKNPLPKDFWHLGTEKVEAAAEEGEGGLKKIIRKIDDVVEETAERVEEKARKAKNRIEEKLDRD